MSVFCTYCGDEKPLEEIFEHLEACKLDSQLRYSAGVRTAAEAAGSLPPGADHHLTGPASGHSLESLMSLWVDVHPVSVWGAVKAEDVAVDARDATEILPGLFLGNTVAAKNPAWLRAHGIKHIVNCAREITPLSTDELADAGVESVIPVPLRDDEEAALVPASFAAIAAGAAAVHGALQDGMMYTLAQLAVCRGVPPARARLDLPADGEIVAALPKPVLVHCAVGRSRSASTILAYLVQYRGLSLLDACMLLKARRPIFLPNFGFLAALVAMEEQVTRAPTSLPPELLNCHPAALRRFDYVSGARLRADEVADTQRIARLQSLPSTAE